MIRKKMMVAFAAILLLAPVFTQAKGLNEEHPESIRMDYGSNVVRLAPVTAMDVGVGFGLSYEKIFGKEQMVGIVLPVTLLLQNKSSYDYNGSTTQNQYNTYVYFTPGVKFYPFGQRRVTYAVGPNVMLGYGRSNDLQSIIDSYGGVFYTNVKTARFRLGLLINNYVNFQVSKVFNLGLEGGLGMLYMDKASYSGSQYYAGSSNVNYGFDITGQFSLTLGLRF